MIEDLPKVLLVTDVSLSQEGGGVNRTLVNLLKDYPSELLMLFAPESSLKTNPPGKPFNRQFLGFPIEYLPTLNNRLGLLINPLIRLINLQLTAWLPVAQRKQIEAFNPDTIIVCPVSFSTLLLGHKLIQEMKCPYLIYAMDDWIGMEETPWLTGKGKDLISQLLSKATGWLVISEHLKDSFSNRYNLKPDQVMIVHNPVDLSGKKSPEFKIDNPDTFNIVYAGSIWQMHYDALVAVAEAVFELRQEGYSVELVIHTQEATWNFYKDKLQALEVNYGSFIPYQQLDDYLKEADFLLVASSFLPEYEFLTRSSTQTKLTDYMASYRPILSCGPDYSACNTFLKKWNCGIVCETNKVSQIKKLLIEQMNNRILHEKIAAIAFQVLKDNFETRKVTDKLYKFIKQISLIE